MRLIFRSGSGKGFSEVKVVYSGTEYVGSVKEFIGELFLGLLNLFS